MSPKDTVIFDHWSKLYESLMTKTRPAIDSLLAGAIKDLNIGSRGT